MELDQIASQLMNWLKAGSTFERYQAKDCIYLDRKDNAVRMTLYTDNNEYFIVAKSNGIDDEGYLGCVSVSRKVRAGEDWRRGNDLADGGFSKETWDKIVMDIFHYELVDIKQTALHRYEPEQKVRITRQWPTK